MSIGKVILVILATLVIFSTGLVTGVVLVKQMPNAPAPNPPVVQQGLGWPQFLHRVEGELDLTPEQHQRVVGILRDSQQRTRGIAQAEFGTVRERIRAELTPPQKEKFQRLLEERRRRNQEMMSPQNRPFSWPNGQTPPDGSAPPPGQSRPPFDNRPPAPAPPGERPQ